MAELRTRFAHKPTIEEILGPDGLKNAVRFYFTLRSAVVALRIQSAELVGPTWKAESDSYGAYFGNSVASAGDVNGDGYDDVVPSPRCRA